MAGETESKEQDVAPEIDARFATVAIVATRDDVQPDGTIKYWPAGSDGKRYTKEEAEASGLLVHCMRDGVAFYRSAEGKIVIGDGETECDTPTIAFDAALEAKKQR